MSVRVLLLLVLVAGIGAAGWQYRRLELERGASRLEVERLAGFRADVERSVTRARTAQQAYLAPGQGLDFWRAQFAEAIADVTGAMENLRVTAEQDVETTTALDSADRALKVYEGLDRKVRGFIASGNSLMAADVIYEDAIKTSALVVDGVEDARRLLADPHAAAVEGLYRQQQWLAAGSIGGAVLVALLLLPAGRRTVADEASLGGVSASDDEARSGLADLRLGHTHPTRPVAVPAPVADVPPGRTDDSETAATAPPPARTPWPPAAAAAAAAVAADEALESAARICTDLARVKDGDQLREALGRAARVLDATGVIVWIADSSGRSLKPLLTYGYPEEALRRIPTLPREADNATAAAWRDGAVQVVDATEAAPGAVAVPILGPQGCMGVLAAEIGHHREASAYTRAVAQIVAAQLAVLIPPDTTAEA